MTLNLLAGLAVLLLLVLFAVLVRRRFGNVYQALGDALERRTGITMAQVARALGLLTLAAWAAVYLLFGSDEKEGLDSLVPHKLTDPADGQAPPRPGPSEIPGQPPQ